MTRRIRDTTRIDREKMETDERIHSASFFKDYYTRQMELKTVERIHIPDFQRFKVDYNRLGWTTNKTSQRLKRKKENAARSEKWRTGKSSLIKTDTKGVVTLSVESASVASERALFNMACSEYTILVACLTRPDQNKKRQTKREKKQSETDRLRRRRSERDESRKRNKREEQVNVTLN